MHARPDHVHALPRRHAGLSKTQKITPKSGSAHCECNGRCCDCQKGFLFDTEVCGLTAEHAPSSAGVPAASLQNVKIHGPPRGFPCGGHVFAQRADFICSKAIIEYIYYLFPDSMKTKQSEPRAIQDSDRSGCLIFFVWLLGFTSMHISGLFLPFQSGRAHMDFHTSGSASMRLISESVSGLRISSFRSMEHMMDIAPRISPYTRSGKDTVRQPLSHSSLCTE